MSSRSYLSGSAKRKRKRERDIAKNKNSRIDLFMKQKSEFVNSAPATETIDENETDMVSGVSIIPEVSNVGSPIKTLSSNEENFKNKDSETGVSCINKTNELTLNDESLVEKRNTCSQCFDSDPASWHEINDHMIEYHIQNPPPQNIDLLRETEIICSGNVKRSLTQGNFFHLKKKW